MTPPDVNEKGFLRRGAVINGNEAQDGALGPLVIAGIDGEGVDVVEVDDGNRLLLDYYTPAGSASEQVRYMGTAPQGTAQSAETWTVKRLTWTHGSDDADHLTDMQVLTGSWTGRAALGWS
jgi:hypothetical protein